MCSTILCERSARRSTILFATTSWNRITIETFRKVRERNNIFNTKVVLQKFFRIRKNSDDVDDGEERWKILFVLLLYKNEKRLMHDVHFSLFTQRSSFHRRWWLRASRHSVISWLFHHRTRRHLRYYSSQTVRQQGPLRCHCSKAVPSRIVWTKGVVFTARCLR